MTYEGMFDEVDCKFELKRAKKYIKKQSDLILALEKQLEEKENEILMIKQKGKNDWDIFRCTNGVTSVVVIYFARINLECV